MVYDVAVDVVQTSNSQEIMESQEKQPRTTKLHHGGMLAKGGDGAVLGKVERYGYW